METSLETQRRIDERNIPRDNADLDLGGAARREENRWVAQTRAEAIELAEKVTARIPKLIADARTEKKPACEVFSMAHTVVSSIAAGFVSEYCKEQGLPFLEDRHQVDVLQKSGDNPTAKSAERIVITVKL